MTALSRREFLKITALAGGVMAVGSLVELEFRQRRLSLKEEREMMGTVVHLTVIADDEKLRRQALHHTFEQMEHLVRIFDTRNLQSPVSVLNRAGRLDSAPDELLTLLAVAQEMSERSHGAFDITVKPMVDALSAGRLPSNSMKALVDYRNLSRKGRSIRFKIPGAQVTFDAIAKGFVVGGVAALKELGFDSVLVEAGGDLMASGRPSHQRAWEIGVEHPRPEQFNGYVARFSLSDQAAATSGDYFIAYNEDRSLNHIVDPRTGVSPLGLASATALAGRAAVADAMSTTIMVLGAEEGLALANQTEGVEALVVTKDLVVKRTSGFPKDH
jgi:thiamine biosynthesis lipoprotein